MFDFLKQKSSKNSLADVIIKGEKSGYGAFVDLNNDLAAFFEDTNKDHDPLIMLTQGGLLLLAWFYKVDSSKS